MNLSTRQHQISGLIAATWRAWLAVVTNDSVSIQRTPAAAAEPLVTCTHFCATLLAVVLPVSLLFRFAKCGVRPLEELIMFHTACQNIIIGQVIATRLACRSVLADDGSPINASADSLGTISVSAWRESAQQGCRQQHRCNPLHDGGSCQ